MHDARDTAVEAMARYLNQISYPLRSWEALTEFDRRRLFREGRWVLDNVLEPYVRERERNVATIADRRRPTERQVTMTREQLIAAATDIHDREGCRCDRKYLMSCTRMAAAILRSAPGGDRG